MNVENKKLIIFDLDGTLAPSKSPMEPETAALIVKLLAKKKIAVMSGGGFPQFQTQFLASLPGAANNYSNLYLLPTSGTRLYAWKGGWMEQFAENLTHSEKQKIIAALSVALKAAGFEKPDKAYGQLIEDRGSQITFSGLGQSAPLAAKLQWDPTRVKRDQIVTVLKKKIPEFDSRIGGTTSVDVTKKGVNKGYGIRKLEGFLHMPLEDMVFVGDSLFHGGNDYPAKATGIDCIQVSGPFETTKLLASWVRS